MGCYQLRLRPQKRRYDHSGEAPFRSLPMRHGDAGESAMASTEPYGQCTNVVTELRGAVTGTRIYTLAISVPRRRTIGEGIYNTDWPSVVMPCLLNVEDCQVIE